ncbi:hypothetical protein Taro_019594 [Colocasia esculenta]|uniref:Uncharacterized protein n=1 Tax=Colocasia esculenta TaxID=4460 RepID=A0A843UX82_COLES|nr:hypothetical protein [Colocasia esculenta]
MQTPLSSSFSPSSLPFSSPRWGSLPSPFSGGLGVEVPACSWQSIRAAWSEEEAEPVAGEQRSGRCVLLLATSGGGLVALVVTMLSHVHVEGCFRIMFDFDVSLGVASGPTLVVGRGVTLFLCFIVLCSRVVLPLFFGVPAALAVPVDRPGLAVDRQVHLSTDESHLSTTTNFSEAFGFWELEACRQIVSICRQMRAICRQLLTFQKLLGSGSLRLVDR